MCAAGRAAHGEHTLVRRGRSSASCTLPTSPAARSGRPPSAPLFDRPRLPRRVLSARRLHPVVARSHAARYAATERETSHATAPPGAAPPP